MTALPEHQHSLFSLRVRIALAFIGLIVLAVSALGVAVARGEEQHFRRSLDERLLVEARLVAEAAAPALATDQGIAAIDPLAKLLGEAGGVRVTVIAPDGTVLGDSENDPRLLENHGQRPEVLAALGGQIGRATRDSATESRSLTYLAVPVGAEGRLLGVARVSLAVSTVNADLRSLASSVLAVAMVAGAVAIALALVIARAVTRPLERLRAAAVALPGGGGGNLPTGGGREVSDVAQAFNEMARRLKETEETREQEHAHVEALLASSTDGLVALDREGIVRYLNPAAVALCGEVTGRSLAEVVRDPELTKLLRAGLPGRELLPLARRKGGEAATIYLDSRDMWLQATLTGIEGGGGWAILLVLHDMTEVRHAEATRRDFVANVSHELRTPLAGIKAVVETLMDGALDDRSAAREFLGQADAEVDRLVQLVDELLQLARIESEAVVEMTEVRPTAVLEGCIARFRSQADRAGIVLTLEAAEVLPAVRCSPSQIAQAIGNLVHNALKFTAAGGGVSVKADRVGRDLRLSVSDTGRGIEPVDLARIFERFYVVDRARSGGGSGLGLAIVKHVVRAHDGRLEVSSVPGSGSTFTILLPLADAEA